MSFRRSAGVLLLPVVAVVGLVAGGCALPSAGPVDKVIPLSATCNLEVRVGGDANGSFLAARNSGVCSDFPDPTDYIPEELGGLRIETSETSAGCYIEDSFTNCSTYTEGLPGQPLAQWYQITAPGALVEATVLIIVEFGVYDEIVVWP